jgi:hypothetical protein
VEEKEKKEKVEVEMDKMKVEVLLSNDIGSILSVIILLM